MRVWHWRTGALALAARSATSRVELGKSCLQVATRPRTLTSLLTSSVRWIFCRPGPPRRKLLGNAETSRSRITIDEDGRVFIFTSWLDTSKQTSFQRSRRRRGKWGFSGIDDGFAIRPTPHSESPAFLELAEQQQQRQQASNACCSRSKEAAAVPGDAGRGDADAAVAIDIKRSERMWRQRGTGFRAWRDELAQEHAGALAHGAAPEHRRRRPGARQRC